MRTRKGKGKNPKANANAIHPNSAVLEGEFLRRESKLFKVRKLLKNPERTRTRKGKEKGKGKTLKANANAIHPNSAVLEGEFFREGEINNPERPRMRVRMRTRYIRAPPFLRGAKII
jgi:hypothetical protein